MKNPWVVIGVITIVLFGGAIWFSSVSGEKNNEGVVLQENVFGNPDAEVVLTEYSDFQCPACAAFEPALQGVLEEYGDQIRFEYKHFPLPIHPYAQQAALAAEAAGQQDKFFEFHDLLFVNQQEWSASPAPAALFAQYAQELDLDMDQFRRQSKSSVLRDRVQADMSEGRALNVTGTPSFFLNGEKMEIATYQDFVEQVAMAVDPEAAAAASASSTDASVVGEGSGEAVRFGI